MAKTASTCRIALRLPRGCDAGRSGQSHRLITTVRSTSTNTPAVRHQTTGLIDWGADKESPVACECSCRPPQRSDFETKADNDRRADPC
jgi:hypothetical protein